MPVRVKIEPYQDGDATLLYQGDLVKYNTKTSKLSFYRPVEGSAKRFTQLRNAAGKRHTDLNEDPNHQRFVGDPPRKIVFVFTGHDSERVGNPLIAAVGDTDQTTATPTATLFQRLTKKLRKKQKVHLPSKREKKNEHVRWYILKGIDPHYGKEE